MLARLLAALPSVRTARDLAVAEERLRLSFDALEATRALLDHERAQRRELQAKYDRLVEARLYRQGDIAAPVLTQPMSSAPAATGSPFGAFARLAWPANGSTTPQPVGDDEMQ